MYFEYAFSVNKSEKEIEKVMENAQLMVGFLDMINASNKFYICRNLDLAGPLLELQSMAHRISDEDKRKDLIESVYVNYLMKPDSDMTRYVRKLKKLINTEYLDLYLTGQKELNVCALALIPADSKLMTDEYIINNIRTNTDLCDKLSNNLNKCVVMSNSTETRNRLTKLVNDSLIKLEEIDDRIFDKLDDTQKKELLQSIEQLEKKIAELKGKI